MFYILIKVEFYTFLYNNTSIIPFKIVETFAKRQYPKIKPDFEKADTFCMINFIIKNIKIFMKKSAFNNENPLELFKNYKKSI